MQYLKLLDPSINVKKNQLVPISIMPVTLGRESDCTIVYSESNKQVSRRHASVAINKNSIHIKNLSSTNCSYVNSKAVVLSRKLFENDIVSLTPHGPSLQVILKAKHSNNVILDRLVLVSLVLNIVLAVIFAFLCLKAKHI